MGRRPAPPPPPGGGGGPFPSPQFSEGLGSVRRVSRAPATAPQCRAGGTLSEVPDRPPAAEAA